MIGARPLIGAAALLLSFNSAASSQDAPEPSARWRPAEPMAEVGYQHGVTRLLNGGLLVQGGSVPAPVVPVMSLANEQPGRVGLSGASEWSDTGIRTGLTGDLPPGLALVVVSDSRGALTATVIALPTRGPDAR